MTPTSITPNFPNHLFTPPQNGGRVTLPGARESDDAPVHTAPRTEPEAPVPTPKPKPSARARRVAAPTSLRIVCDVMRTLRTPMTRAALVEQSPLTMGQIKTATNHGVDTGVLQFAGHLDGKRLYAVVPAQGTFSPRSMVTSPPTPPPPAPAPPTPPAPAEDSPVAKPVRGVNVTRDILRIISIAHRHEDPALFLRTIADEMAAEAAQ